MGITISDWIALGVLIIALVSIILNLYQFIHRKKGKREEKIEELEVEKEFNEQQQVYKDRTAEGMYSAALREELGNIHLVGSPDMYSPAVSLQDAFVSLSISESWRSEDRFDAPKILKEMEVYEGERHLSPGMVMKRAFKKYNVLLVIGDPGSGKTTLLKYYALTCLDKNAKKWRQLGFEKEIMPLYFPLRELLFDDNNVPVSLPDNLAKWCDSHSLDITAKHFHHCLQHRSTLVLLDGLDEISSKKLRKKVCKWITRMRTGLSKARFVVTSRATGYRKLDGIELEFPHLRADIMDFNLQQQEEFLSKWFRAVFSSGLPPESVSEQQWKQWQLKRADQRSKTIIDFLKDEKNKAVRELAAVPMLLQIMAIIWKDRKHIPDSRPALYDAALNYLLAYRDEEKEIEPLLPVEQSRRVLAPAALWMQEELEKDEAPIEDMHNKMQPVLNTFGKEKRHEAVDFCAFLRDRAGVIADYDRDHYIFRHKSFREFLAGIQLNEDAHEEKCLKALSHHFKDDWWEETLRFFISKSSAKIFDRFMRTFFQSKVSRQLDAHQQTLLQHLIIEAPQKKIDALVACLNNGKLNNNQKRYVIDCLKTIGTPEALEAIEKADRSKMDKSTISYAEDIIAEASLIEMPRQKDLETLSSFRNPFEDNVEYIKIPGGTYKYSDTGEMKTVPPLYFCKYPVTNKRYRRFISFLAGNERDLLNKIPLEMFGEKLLKFAGSIKGYDNYLGKDTKEWAGKLRSRYDDNKRFKGEDQPVVGVSWYAARAYCFWLSCLEAALKEDKKLENIDDGRIASIYRLPTEIEWEWAAGGEKDGSVREYPWPKDKGDPNPELANFGENVGATTPVNRYPEGATPAGLMDMAGNVWEWMENYYDKAKDWRSLRGGSWGNDTPWLRCSARLILNPGLDLNVYAGFRVAFPQS